MKYKASDITSITSGMILHGCNARGLMRAGVAKAIRKHWPLAYKVYLARYVDHGLWLGDIVWTDWMGDIIIGNCITQSKYGYNGVYADLVAIEDCLKKAFSEAIKWKTPVYMPPIGCGYGGLEWPEVYGIVKKYEKDVDLTIVSNDPHWVRYARQFNG